MDSKIPCLAVAAALVGAASPWAAPPEILGVQGRLTTAGGDPVVDPVDVTVRLYTVEVGGTAIHAEVDSVVPDASGVFRTSVGDGPALDLADFTQQLWVGFTVDEAGGGVEAGPRIPLRAAPYALRASGVAELEAQVARQQILIELLLPAYVDEHLYTYSNGAVGSGAGSQNHFALDLDDSGSPFPGTQADCTAGLCTSSSTDAVVGFSKAGDDLEFVVATGRATMFAGDGGNPPRIKACTNGATRRLEDYASIDTSTFLDASDSTSETISGFFATSAVTHERTFGFETSEGRFALFEVGATSMNPGQFSVQMRWITFPSATVTLFPSAVEDEC